MGSAHKTTQEKEVEQRHKQGKRKTKEENYLSYEVVAPSPLHSCTLLPTADLPLIILCASSLIEPGETYKYKLTWQQWLLLCTYM